MCLPRTPRKISNTGIYHVMLRGINKQDIFFDSKDKYKFLKELKETKEKYQYELYAYCLMPNHVHLLICAKNETISKVMQSINVRYSVYFNLRYGRVGHLFQNRFLSKTVENQEYLMTLQRYIHQNPQKARIAKTEEYKWSSYNEYLYGNGITDRNFILKMFDDYKWTAIDKFIQYNNCDYPIDKLQEYEFEFIKLLTDEDLIEIIKEKLNISNVTEIKKYNKEIRDRMIRDVLKIKGVTITQISKVLGITRKMIQRAKIS